jgi:hypothetical protein
MNYDSYLKANVDSVHKLWVENLRDIRQVTDPVARSIYIDDLKDLYHRATLLDQEQGLHPQMKGCLAHILDRPLDQHLALIKNLRNVL